MKQSGIRGMVVEELPNRLYKVDCGERQMICYLSGKMKVNHIKVIIGDWVEVVVDPYGGKSTNRIIKRL